MARGSATADTASKTAEADSGTFMNNANSVYSNVVPMLTSQAAHPQGFDPADEAAMETGALQEAGGTQAAAVGQGNLEAARTRNAGGFGQAVSDASRGAGENLSRGLLGVRNANSQLKQHQHDTALSGLQGLYGTTAGASNAALGNVAPLVNADTNAEHQSWDAFNNITGAISNAASAASGFKKPCWVAEAIYGIDDPRTHLVRAWINGPFRETAVGNAVRGLYLAIGQQVAWAARRSSLLRAALKPLFDAALRKAQRSGMEDCPQCPCGGWVFVLPFSRLGKCGACGVEYCVTRKVAP